MHGRPQRSGSGEARACRHAVSTWFSITPTTGSAGPPRRRWKRTVRALAATVCMRYVFMSSVAAYGDGLNHHERRCAGAGRSPDPYARNKADERARAVPHALSRRLSGGDLAAAVCLWPGQSVLSRGILLGPHARRPADHPAGRRPPADAVRLCQRSGRGDDRVDVGAGSGGRGVQYRRTPRALSQLEVVRASGGRLARRPNRAHRARQDSGSRRESDGRACVFRGLFRSAIRLRR